LRMKDLPFFIFKIRLQFVTLRFAVGLKMKLVKLQETQSTIRFSAELLRPAATEKIGSRTLLTLPKNASAKLPSRGMTMVEGTINGFPFRAPLEPDGLGSHCLRVDEAMQEAAGADAGDTVTVEITRTGKEPEIRVPTDLREALAAAPLAQALWSAITPMARRDWILWISSAKQPETRGSRIEKACDMLSSGKRRVCCFGGLNWLRKDHGTAGETWLPLPGSLNRFSPKSTIKQAYRKK
jgi:Bacteriocin-protection, YdeI or OmpD-Associated/Domain of unknown function (DUF1905)